MTAKPESLTVFILTYNRADFLRAALKSLLAQTVQGFRIIVLDNGSTDGTEDLVCALAEQGVEYLGTDGQGNRGAEWNFNRAIEIAETPWTMLFHDDDILYPDYLEKALAVLADRPQLALCCSTAEIGYAPTPFDRVGTVQYDIIDQVGLAEKLYSLCPIVFCSAIFRTERIKETPIRWGDYGKHADRPWMLEVVGQDQAVVFLTPMLFYRLHGGQDSATSHNAAGFEALNRLLVLYRTLLGCSLAKASGRTFLMYNLTNVIASYALCGRNVKGYIDYLGKTIESGALAWPSLLLFGWPSLLRKILGRGFRRITQGKDFQ